ncbi:MAG: M2 family metallopeptidase [Deltaproteobacteria bacterium]|nr:M2 family metallopeptidase [Deltaproteobacteria bacterium]
MIPFRTLLAAAGATALVSCSHAQTAQRPAPLPPPRDMPAEAKAFVDKVNKDLKVLWTKQATAEWVKNTHITDDTERNAAWANETVMAYLSGAIKDSLQFQGVAGLDADTQRMLNLLRLSSSLPAPSDEAQRGELASLAAKLEGMYGKAKACDASGNNCRDLEQLSEVMGKSRKYGELLAAWQGWHDTARPMRPLYAKLSALSNAGAREINFQNLGELWRSGYDMTPAEFEAETDRLWQQVKPLYDDLHCYVRGRLQKTYGADKVPDGQPIPAHLLGNMWAQEWTNVYPLVEPFPGQASLDVGKELVKQKWDAVRMVKLGEGFFTSLGLKPLPQTFYERSQFTKPRDREVVCHASAWDVTYENDLRVKMCIKPTEEDLVTIHHELGHNYYYAHYHTLPVLFQQGANDGFHEAIGDALVLSVGPDYYQKVGLLPGKRAESDKALINLQMKDALERVAFLPFGKFIDQWRWDVFAGKVTEENYNAAWWELRRKYQGVAPPVARSEGDFDAGAKYHIPSNVPYTRYFLARILQFQFHRALCKVAGQTGPLHACSVYGNKQAGAKLQAMLEMGARKPWPDALEALTGERQMDATALLDYFAPLQTWLKEQNKGRSCGW